MPPRSGTHDDARAGAGEVARDVDVRAVDAEDQLGARLAPPSRISRAIEGVDADAHPRRHEIADDVAAEPGTPARACSRCR